MDDVVPRREIVARDRRASCRSSRSIPTTPARSRERWRYRDGSGEIGVIASVTQAFCRDCTRARLSTDGKLYTCLFATHGYDLRALLRGGASDDDDRATRSRAIWRAARRPLFGDPHARTRARAAQGRDDLHRRLSTVDASPHTCSAVPAAADATPRGRRRSTSPPSTSTAPSRDVPIAGEHPLTLYVDKREILTLMTLGAAPEALAIGYLRNQRLRRPHRGHRRGAGRLGVERRSSITTRNGLADLDAKTAKRTTTTRLRPGHGVRRPDGRDRRASGCRADATLTQATLYALLDRVRAARDDLQAGGRRARLRARDQRPATRARS